MTLKEFITDVFNIQTYEYENGRLAEEKNNLAYMLETEKATSAALARKLVVSEAENEALKKDVTTYIENAVNNRVALIEAEMTDAMNHKWYNAGRFDAYADMGIRNIEAHERGNQLIRTPDGEIVELILGLEDVTGKTYSHDEAWDEIKIDDLITE